MQEAEARRSERINYRGAVELLALGDAIEPRRVRGVAVDLGAGGMRVAVRSQMAVGSHVTCKLELDGRPASLAGRVAWARRGDDAHGIGICFEELSGYDSALLQHMIERSRAGYRAVELRFADIDEPILARARRRTNGLRLSAPLPIFARGSELSFRLDEEGPLLTGRIGDSSLWEDGRAPRIEVDVDMVDHESVRFRRNARYGFPNEIERAEQEPVRPRLERRAETAPVARERVTTERTSAAPTFALLPLTLSIAFGATVGYAAAAVEAPRAPERRPAQARAHDQSRAAASTSSLRQAVSEPQVAIARPAQPSDPAQNAAQTRMDSAAAEPAEPAVTDAIPAAPQPQRPFLFAPELRAAGARTVVRFPLDGSIEDMRVLRWTDPLALNFYLPHGRVPLSVGLYRTSKGSVRNVMFQTEGSEQLVRVQLTTALKQYTMHLDGGMVELNLEQE